MTEEDAGRPKDDGPAAANCPRAPLELSFVFVDDGRARSLVRTARGRERWMCRMRVGERRNL